MRVILNFAISADGKIGTHTGGASKFTSRSDLERLWEIRKAADAIMVGRGTLEADNMTMTVPGDVAQQPKRIIVSRTGKFNYNHPVFNKSGGDIHLLSTETPAVSPLPSVETHHMPLADFLSHCENVLKIEALLCEGGGEIVRSLVDLEVITDIHLTLAGHTLIGGKEAPGILGKSLSHLVASQQLQLTHFQENAASELFLSYKKRGH